MSEPHVITWTKSCGCRGASASGPRIVVTKEQSVGPSELIVGMRYVEKACDACDSPWVRRPDAEEGDRSEQKTFGEAADEFRRAWRGFWFWVSVAAHRDAGRLRDLMARVLKRKP